MANGIDMEFIGDEVHLGSNEPTAFGMTREFPVDEAYQRAGLLHAFAKDIERRAETLAQSQFGVDREQAQTFAARAAGMYTLSEQLRELSPNDIQFRNYIGHGLRRAEIFANNASS